MSCTCPDGALDDARLRIANLEQALVNARTIGAALGILMERLKLTNDEAFAELVNASQHRNIKLHVVAEHLVTTGELPTDGARSRRAPAA